MLDLNYDRNNDIMYLCLENKDNSYGDEVVDGFVIMRDILTDKVTGYTIFDFFKKYRHNELINLPLPIPVNFDKEIISKINL